MTGNKVLLMCSLMCCSLGLSAGARNIVFHITPAEEGIQLVRVSLPLPKGAVVEGRTVEVSDGTRKKPVGFRPLTWYPAGNTELRSVRRAIVTFPYEFHSTSAVRFVLTEAEVNTGNSDARLPVEVKSDGATVALDYRNGPSVIAKLVAPERTCRAELRTETVENNRFFLWQRFHVADGNWPRIIEVRADSLGGVVLVAHLKRNLPSDGRAPNFGWKLETESGIARLVADGKRGEVGQIPVSHEFARGGSCRFLFDTRQGQYMIYHPTALLNRRGGVTALIKQGRLSYDYLRCMADEKVPMQESAWRRAEICLSPVSLASVTPTLQPPHQVQVDWTVWNELYRTGKPLALRSQPELRRLIEYHRNAIVKSVAVGDDWGNVTGYEEGSESGTVFGMNRLNQCPFIFEEGYRSGDRRLTEAAVAWCDNMHDLSIWWGTGSGRGGTRYNSLSARGEPVPDLKFMWRTNWPSDFCTKGYDSFFYAYEETGDPRMKETLDAQVEYASSYVHCNTGQCRNIGDVRDFVRLYQFTGERKYLDEALRLFRELRAKLSTRDLFSQGGEPIAENPSFIDNDETGYKYPFAKPYIIGYALAGLPELLEYAPNEPKLRDVVTAVADFLAKSQDPLGGWRYPHPSSTRILMQYIENPWQLVQAENVLGPQESHIDAIERSLRARILVWRKAGTILSMVEGWEFREGNKTSQDIESMYKRPEERNPSRDYTDGKIILGSSAPEGIVYLHDTLAYYLKHRPASRLFAPAMEDDPLGQVLSRIEDRRR